MPDSIYIIVITHNASNWLELCCAPFRELPVGWKLLVVDNASTDGTPDALKRMFPFVHLIESPVNLGFGRANNLALRLALQEGASHALLLNQDAEISLDSIMRLVDVQRRYPEYAAVSPTHLEGTGQNLDYSFANSCLPKNCSGFMKDAFASTLHDIYPAMEGNAAVWLLSRRCLSEVGGFSPAFFHYGEDNNYLHRMLFHGLRFGVTPRVSIRHHRPQTPKRKQLGRSYTDKLIRYSDPSLPSPSRIRFCLVALGQTLSLLFKGDAVAAAFILRNHLARWGGKLLAARQQTMNKGPSFLENTPQHADNEERELPFSCVTSPPESVKRHDAFS